MPSLLPSVPYPPAGDGFWGSVTSTLNWCEEDYYATIYSAEIVNSITNLWFVYLGCKGITNCLKNGHDRVFLVAFISYTCIGIGSFIFHSTLKYTAQLIDELSMIYTTCILSYAIFSHGQSTRSRIVLSVFLTALALFITGYYHYLKDPLFHQNMFSLITTVVLLRSIFVMEMALRPSRRVNLAKSSSVTTNESEQERIALRDEAILKTMWGLVICGVASVGFGFLIWNLDGIFCSTLRRWRREIGLPWGILLEGHGWWHIWTGIAEYFNITWGIWLRYCLNGKQDTVDLHWPSLISSIPVVEKKDGSGEDEKKRN